MTRASLSSTVSTSCKAIRQILADVVWSDPENVDLCLDAVRAELINMEVSGYVRRHQNRLQSTMRAVRVVPVGDPEPIEL